MSYKIRQASRRELDTKEIKFIYFDVGGVLILDFSETTKWDEMLSDLGLVGELKQQFSALFAEHEERIARGEDVGAFVEAARSKLGVSFPPDYDMTADFVSRFALNPSMLKLVTKLREDYKLGLLTAQYPGMLEMIKGRGLIPPEMKWDVVIDSSVEGMTKPELEIYLLAEEKAGVSAEEILFVDNKPQLLQIPRERGWQVSAYDPQYPELSTRQLEKLIYSRSI